MINGVPTNNVKEIKRRKTPAGGQAQVFNFYRNPCAPTRMETAIINRKEHNPMQRILVNKSGRAAAVTEPQSLSFYPHRSL